MWITAPALIATGSHSIQPEASQQRQNVELNQETPFKNANIYSSATSQISKSTFFLSLLISIPCWWSLPSIQVLEMKG
jgi:hypothetical protein